MKLPEIIAVDGPAASGKSTVAERLAKGLGYLFFDTGVMYRAVTWAALKVLHRVDDESAVSELAKKVCIDISPSSIQDGRKYDVHLDGEDITWEIRTPEVEAAVSQVSAYKIVREEMVAQQRVIGLRGNVVMAGRDIGTVVFPEAKMKFYLEASVKERARRRYTEVNDRGEKTSYEDILASMKQRDQIDSTRIIAPLRPAKDAIIINTDGKSVDEVVEEIETYLF